MKIRRSERLIDMTQFLLSHPRKLVPLTMFAERYGSAKSSISEDLVIIKKTFEDRGIGTLETVPGAAGGVQYISIAEMTMCWILCIRYVIELRNQTVCFQGLFVLI